MAQAGYFQGCPTRKGCICESTADKIGYTEMERGWAGLAGAIFCICLQDRPERFAAACAEAHRWGLCRLIRFYRPRKPTDAELAAANVTLRGFFGSWESHRTIARAALAQQVPRALILEDDFQLLPEYMSAAALHRIRQDMDRVRDGDGRDGWDMWFLGHQPVPCSGWPAMWPPRVMRTRSCWIHAYILNRQGQRLLSSRSYVDQARAEGETTLDTWLRQVARQYATCPMIAVQSCIGSDNLPAGDRYARLVEWWTAVHKAHSTAIEIVAFVVIPLLLALVSLWLVTVFLRLAVPRRRHHSVAILPATT